MARVLVIDDDVGTRETFDQILRLDGYAVDVAATGFDGLYLSRKPLLGLVLADFRLPDVDGLTLFQLLRAEGVETPFILMTGFASTETAFDAGRLGVAEYLEKPIVAEELLRIVRAHTRAGVNPSALFGPVTASSAHVELVCRLIEQHYSDRAFDIHALAVACGITREHLARVIHAHTGLNFTQLLRARRMTEARRLLVRTNLRIKDIYQHVGLTSASDFDHAFRQTVGISPRAYRATWGGRCVGSGNS